MTANLQLSGEYTVQGRRLLSTDKPFYLVLTERKQTTPGKPPQFIVAKCPDCTFQPTGKNEQYVSSVYGSGRIEYNGKNYCLVIENDKAVITESAVYNKSTLYR